MSLLDFFNQNPPVQVFTPAQFNLTNPSGMARLNLKAGRMVRGRILGGSGHQAPGWFNSTLPVKSDYRLLTFDSQIGNGDFILTRDRGTFRVTGAGQIVYKAGTIPQQYTYPLEQIMRRTPTEIPTGGMQ